MTEIIFKLFLAILLGGLIGLEREFSQKPAGLRTNILICAGSAMMVILSQMMLEGKGANTGDALRIAAGVITGMGFIGAGAIIQSRGIVHGLTTASTLWAVAGLGLVIGAGYYLVGTVFSGLVILTLVLLRRLEESFLKKGLHHYRLKVKDSPDWLSRLRELTSHIGIKLEEISLKKEGELALINFQFSSSAGKEEEFSRKLMNLGEISEVHID
ncbi:MAG: MgtC/SapB family protein [Candidatus Aminicenantales bacterium]